MFVATAFLLAPVFFGVWPVFGVGVLFTLMVGQHLLQLALTIAETPIGDLVVSVVRSSEQEGTEDSATVWSSLG